MRRVNARSVTALGFVLFLMWIPSAEADDLRAAVAGTTSSTTATGATPGQFVFKSDGVLTGQPPQTVGKNKKVVFSVISDEATQRAQIRDVAATLITAIEGINVTIKERAVPDFLLLGITTDRLAEIRGTYCGNAAALVQGLEASAERDSLEQRLIEACTGPQTSLDLLPQFAIGADSYAMSFFCRDRGESPIKPTSTPKTEFVMFEDPGSDCRERAYQLRLVKPIAAASEKWATDNPMPTDVRKAAADAREDYKKKAKDLKAVATNHKKLAECLEAADTKVDEIMKCAGQPTNKDEAFKRLDAARAELQKTNDDLKKIFSGVANATAANWVERWLWITGGRPTLHPLATDALAPLRRELKAKKVELSGLDARLATFDKLTGAGVKIDNPANLVDTVNTLGKTKQDREKMAAEVADLTKKITALEQTQLRDTFLYDGTYLIGNNVYMQHHDALNQYVIMGPPIVEIREEERVAILAENADPAAELKIVQTLTPITNDRSKFVDELVLTKGPAQEAEDEIDAAAFAALSDAKKDVVLRDLAKLVKSLHDHLVRGLAFADIELNDAPMVIRLASDDTPARVTKVVPHDVPSPAPAVVAYTITKREGNEDKTVGRGSYRLNRLYRVRLRTGLLYSTLESTSINEDDEEEVSQHGVDALFGVSTYLGRRRDPRQIDGWSEGAWSLLTALTVREPTQNLLVGVGYEPYGGITLSIGGHVGRSERLRNDPGNPKVEDQWNARPFFAITFDVDFLKQLFTIKPTV